jgi:hypothetical protein
VVGVFSWWMSKMMMNEFGVYLSSLAEQRGFRLPALAVRAETETLADDLTCDRLASSATSISIFSHNINHTNMGDHLPCESTLPSYYISSH